MWVGLAYSGLPKAISKSLFNISLRLRRTIFFAFDLLWHSKQNMLPVYLKVLKQFDWILANCSCKEKSNMQPWISIVHSDLSNPQQDWRLRRSYYQDCLCSAGVPIARFGNRPQWADWWRDKDWLPWTKHWPSSWCKWPPVFPQWTPKTY